MKPTYKYLLNAAMVSTGAGALAIVPVVNSDNGYVAGFVFFPILIFLGIVAFVLFFAGLVTITKKSGPILLVSSLLLPAGFFGAAFISKALGLGAYREQPMGPIVPSISNKVVFKKDATHYDVQKFWSEVLSDRVGESGEKTRPGIQGMSSRPPENGHEIVVFSFFITATATETEKADVRARIQAYEPVSQFLENVDTSPDGHIESKSATMSNSRISSKKSIGGDSTNANQY
ncbi:MAG: hypothetical protein ABIV48_07345 [Pyrinomonadaceae bacterium]